MNKGNQIKALNHVRDLRRKQFEEKPLFGTKKLREFSRPYNDISKDLTYMKVIRESQST